MKQEKLSLDTRVNGYMRHVCSCSLFLGGEPVSQTNRKILAGCLEAWFYLSEDLMIRSNIPDIARDVRILNFVHAFTSCDLKNVLSFFDNVYLLLIREDISFDEFKQHQCLSLSGEDVSGRLLSPINVSLSSFFLEDDKVKKAYFLRSILQFVRFGSKMSLQDLSLEQEALIAYRQTEEDLQSMIHNFDDGLIAGLSAVVKEWFQDFRIDLLKPNHGSGSVSEGPLSLEEKFFSLGIDAKLEIALRRNCDRKYFEGYYPFPPEYKFERVSRTIFVPKTALKLRTISMEPASLQYIQQGVMKDIYRYIEKHPYLGVRVILKDQRQNQFLAQEGSIYGNYATVDLSHASDSVSWELVRRVFRSVPHLYKWLVATRSDRTLLPDGQTITLTKYAPMGSALCFPIECIIFSAIVEHASRNWCKTHRSGFPLYSVYGDDLVIPTDIYDEVVRLLNLCGFTVNTRKSYSTGPYRESCGKDYYAGIDVSALYYRIPFYNRRLSPSAYESMCSAANNAVVHNLPLFRLYWINKIQAEGPRPGPYFGHVPTMSPQLYSSQPTNFHVKARWNRGYQRYEGRFLTVKSRPLGEKTTDDTILYFCKLVSMARRSKTTKAITDEFSSSLALHGCVEYFSSTIMPIIPRYQTNLFEACNWFDT